MIAEQEARGDFSKREPTVMPISIHSFHAPSGIGMNFNDTSQRPAPWRSSGPVLPDSWSTPDPRLLRGDKLYIVLAMFLSKFWDYCCFTRLTQSRRTNYVQNDPDPLLGRRRRRTFSIAKIDIMAIENVLFEFVDCRFGNRKRFI